MRNVIPTLYCGIVKEEIAVTATTITIIGLTIPASTAPDQLLNHPQFPLQAQSV